MNKAELMAELLDKIDWAAKGLEDWKLKEDLGEVDLARTDGEISALAFVRSWVVRLGEEK